MFFLFSSAQKNTKGEIPALGVETIKRQTTVNNVNTQRPRINTTSIPSPSTPTGSSAELGVTPGQLDVSLTGAATYSIPVAVPPGINGCVPQISLTYNSQAGNGAAGYGWNITGVSIITKIPSTKFHDGSIDGVDFDENDRYALDGQRLVIKSNTNGTYGADGTQYETESFSNVLITSYGVHPNGAQYGPSYFIVQYPDGSEARYGNSSSSISKSDWAITYWQNRQGIRINYNYTLSGNILDITSITYGSKLDTPSINEISFVYNTRNRPEHAYMGGQSFLRTKILKAINVKGKSTGFRNYILEHQTTSLGYERLKSVTEKSGDNSKNFNPTVFNYDTTGNDGLFNVSPPTPLNLADISLASTSNITGDFDGDGKMDFILYPNTGVDAKKKYYLFTNIEGSSTNIGATHNTGTFIDIFPTTWLDHENKLSHKQGWCVIKNTSEGTSFMNYSVGGATAIANQYDKVYAFPRLSYWVGCQGQYHCDLSPNSGGAGDGSIIGRNSVTGPEDPGIDPGDGSGNGPGTIDLPINCASVTNLNLSTIENGEAELSWNPTGAPTASSWEVYYFETGTENAPTNNDPIGTYTTTTQNPYIVTNLNEFKNYTFYVRAICTNNNNSSIANNWVGPLKAGGLILPEGETRYVTIPKEYISGDFNGDGLTDVIVIEKSVSYTNVICHGSCYTTTTAYVAGGKTYFVNLDRRLTDNFVNNSGSISTTNNSKFLVADVNGDGKSDLLVFDSGVVKAYYLNDNNKLVQFINKSDTAIILDKPKYMGDFNGDGKMDFVVPQAEGVDSWSFFFSKGDDFQNVTSSIGMQYLVYNYGYYGILGNTFAYSLNEHSFITNDFNGDGKTDILHQQNFTIEYVMTPRNGADYSNNAAPQVTKLALFENKFANDTGIGFNVAITNAQIGGIKRYPVPIFLDHNSRNQNLEYALISDNKIVTFKATKDNRIDTRLKEIVSGNGVKEVITYSTLSTECDNLNDCNLAFSPSTGTEVYPNYDINVAAGFQIVSKLEQITPTQYKKQKFSYHGAVSNLEGLGFLGFRKLARTNWFNDNYKAITSLSNHDITKRGAIANTFTVLGEMYANAINDYPNFISKSNMKYQAELLENKVYKIKNTLTISYNGLENTSSETSSNFDEYNNPVTSTTITKNSGDVEKTEVLKIKYSNNTSPLSYYIGRIIQKNSTVSVNGSTMTGEERYTYDTESYLVKKIQKKGHLTDFISEENVYDEFGNITEKKITASSDLEPRLTKFSYESSGRFLKSSTDVELLVTNYTFNSNDGLLISRTLPSNDGYPLITSYQYDAWGKKKVEIDYLGKKLNYNYTWINPGNSGYYLTTTLGDDGSASFVYSDDLGRTIAEGYRTINEGGTSEPKNSFKTYEFDIYDRTVKSYEPHLGVSPLFNGIYNETLYDDYARPIKIIEHTGKTTGISYDGLSTITDDGTNTKKSVKNAIGNIISMSDNGGSIKYIYYANGNLRQSDFDGVVIKMEQDGWGRKTKMTDPSAGTYEYKYNAFGETIEEITPKGKTTYIIDDYGRIKEKNINGINGDNTNTKTTYVYSNTTHLLTDIVYEDFTGSSVIQYFYDYDDYRRLNFMTENGFNAYYQRAIQFDSFGRAEKELYTAIETLGYKSSSRWIRNTYKNGHHWQIFDLESDKLLWQNTKFNGRSQLLSGNYGNGININNTYDEHGFPTVKEHFKSGDSDSHIDVMTIKNEFDTERGNLLNRNNSLFSYNENFKYDNLDRLTNWDSQSLIHGFSFTNNTESFTGTVSGVSLQLDGTSESRLKVTSYGNFQGTQRLIKENAIIGQTLLLEGTVYFTNNVPANYIKVLIVEKNPATGATSETLYSSFSQPTFTFNFEHVVSQYPEVYLKIVAGNDATPQPSLVFSLDNISVTERNEYNQYYDNLGRIKENEVGQYQYGLTDPNTSQPKYFQNSKIELNPAYSEYYVNRSTLDITYNVFKSPVNIYEEGKDRLSFLYGMNNSRSTMYYGGMQQNKLERRFRKHYSTDGSMEIKQNIADGTVEFITYIGGDAYSAPVILRSDGYSQNYYYLHRDQLGSIVAITDRHGEIVEKRHFDAWGNITKVQDREGNNLEGLTVIDRGYTGHEHLQGVVLIHMNARLYDPVVHRFLQPDNFIQDPYNTQNFNRYSYVLNNPLKYTDPSGEYIWIPIIVGAIVGAYSGGVIANQGEFNPVKWNWNMKTVGYMVAGAVLGGITGGTANSIVNSGVAFANTKALLVSSAINGMGTHFYTGGKTHVTLSFGFASLDFTSGRFGYLFQKKNSFMQNLGYTMGAIANFNDVMAGFNTDDISSVDLATEHSDEIGHSALVDSGSTSDDSLVSFGPYEGFSKKPFESVPGQPVWSNHLNDGSPVWRTKISGINIAKIQNYSLNLLKNTPEYNLYYSSCVTHTSSALIRSGFFNIGIHPFILAGQAYLREIGVRTYLSHYLITK